MTSEPISATAEGLPKPPARRVLTEGDLYPHTDVLYPRARALQRQLYLLMRLLEEAFDVNRGSVHEKTVTLKFAEEGLDAMGWLAAQAWSDATDLSELLEKMIAQIEVAA